MNDEMIGAPQGWQCPICKRIYSPTMPMCWYCGGEGTVTAANTSGEREPVTVNLPYIPKKDGAT